MNEALKQRLIGAVILVSLGVIFIPMLLDGGPEDERLTVKMEIPPRPETKAEDRLTQLKEATEMAAAQPLPEKKPKPKPKPQPKPEIEPKPKPAPKPVAKTEVKTPQGEQWVIQLGSFSSETNALVLKDKFRSNGYKNTFVEKGKGETGAVYRVRVGPVQTREQAVSLRDKIKKTEKRDGIVMRHP